MPKPTTRVLTVGVLLVCSIQPFCGCAATTDEPLRQLVRELSKHADVLSPPRASSALGSDGKNQILVDNAGPPIPSYSSRTLDYKDISKFDADFGWVAKGSGSAAATSTGGGKAELLNIWIRELRNPIPDINSALFRTSVGTFSERKKVRLGPICRAEIGCKSVTFSGAAAASVDVAAAASLKVVGLELDASTKTVRSGSGAGSDLVLASASAYLVVDCRPVADKPGGATMDLGDGYTVQVTDVNTEAVADAPQYQLRISQLGGTHVVISPGRFGFTYHMLVSSSGTVTALQVAWYGTGAFKYSKTEFLATWEP